MLPDIILGENRQVGKVGEVGYIGREHSGGLESIAIESVPFQDEMVKADHPGHR